MVRKKKKKKYRLFWHFARLQFLLMIVVLGVVGFYYYGGYGTQVRYMQQEADSFVRSSTPDTFKSAQTSVVYDKNGDTISTLKGEKDVYYLSYEQIPADVISAIVSIEDKKFFHHNGIDYKAILRAIKAMIENGEVKQGASTITQQLARNVFLTQDRTWQRKVEEMFIATGLEKKYNKKQILEFYLNNIYFGNGYYGIQAASMGYFSKPVEQLNLSQKAYLCAIPNNPTLYDPLTNLDKGIQRRNRILNQMYEDEKITKSALVLAKAEGIELELSKKQKNNYLETYTYYCAIRMLMAKEGFVFQREFRSDEERETYQFEYETLYEECQKKLYTEGYRIYTSLNKELEVQLQAAVDEQLQEFTQVNDEGVYQLQGAAVCINNETGYVEAIVGGRSQDFAGYTLNRAYQSYRQPGSAIKPLIVYAPACERGYTPESTVNDQYIEDGPANADGVYSGEITLREAMQRSKNSVAWQLFEELTPEVGLSYLESMEFSHLSEEDYRLTSALGGFTKGVSPLEMAAAYSTLENDGNFREPTCIVKITDAQGVEVAVSDMEEQKVYKTTAARMTTDMMKAVVEEGTGRGLGIGQMESAGKTGTTNDHKDGWFVGYTRYYTTSVWVGYDMPQELPELSGSSYPGRIWHSFMENAHGGLTPLEFLPYVQADAYQRQKEAMEAMEQGEDYILPEDEALYEEEDNGYQNGYEEEGNEYQDEYDNEVEGREE